MKLSDGIKAAYERRWSMINTFSVKINMGNGLTQKIGAFSEDLDLNIVSLTTPDFTNDPIESFIANRWFIHNGKDSLYRFSMTFRDYEQMSLYKKFFEIYSLTKENYFDFVKLTITVTKEGDWAGQDDKKIFEYSGVLVEGLSNISFSNDTENQIAEFSVSFKCTHVTEITES